jgi:prepilin-type N-terminal cleavage/methylation domain-containing protein
MGKLHFDTRGLLQSPAVLADKAGMKTRRRPSSRSYAPPFHGGFTLIELLVAIAVLALVLGFVVSSFSGMLARQRLQGAAENLYDHLSLARTEAINRQKTLHVSIISGDSWCIGLDDGGACNCSTASDCQLDGAEKVSSSSGFSNITLSTLPNALRQFSYDPRRGMPQNTAGSATVSGDITFSNAEGDSLTLKLNSVGRLKLCSSTGFRGYSACP